MVHFPGQLGLHFPFAESIRKLTCWPKPPPPDPLPEGGGPRCRVPSPDGGGTRKGKVLTYL
ncbi:MAG: hypothetical protein ACFFA6_12115 [Promethearchaeota archaeon]